jgi:type IV pilus assembly protein PilW
MREKKMMSRCKGLTLIELMIAMLISLMLMVGAVSIFIGSKKTFKLEEDLSRVQENFRYIADRLTKDLSLTGYTGCILPYQDNSATVSNRLSGTSGVRWVVQGTEGGSPTAPDSLTISYAKPSGGADVLVGSGMNTTDPIYISTNTDLYDALKANLALTSENQVGIALLVGNCDGGDIFVTTGLYENDASDPDSPPSGVVGLKHETGIAVGGLSNAEASFNVAYGNPDLSRARIFSTEDVTYQICTDASGETGLCVSRGGSSMEMLMPDVTNFQVKYGLDSAASEDGNTDRYVDWSDAVSNPDVTSIKVTLTMALTQVGGNDVTRDYSFIVKLRNMGLDV